MPGGQLDALTNLHVLDLSDDVSGSYCAKLLADAGAEVVKVEPPSGHRLRRWSWSGSVGSDGDQDGALFRYLAAGQRSVVADAGSPEGRTRILQLAAGSDVVITSWATGEAGARGLAEADLHAVNPALTVIAITPFGLEGPRAADTSNDFLLQALSGSLHNHGAGDRVPLQIGGGLGEWCVGPYAAAGALAARARTERTGRGELVDVSALECLTATLVCYPSVSARMPGGMRWRSVYTLVPGIEPCKDGYVGLTCLTAQQWHDFASMMDRHDLADDPELGEQRVRVMRAAELQAEIRAWTMEHTALEIVERAASFRVPAAPVLHGGTVTELDHIKARELFDTNPRGGFPHPRPPFRSAQRPRRTVGPAPLLGEHDDLTLAPKAPAAPAAPATGSSQQARPLEGVRVLDVTAFWAGPSATQYLASLGADVIKLESIQRPDAIRFNTTASPTTDQWWETGFLYLSANLDKRGITLNLADRRGRDLALALVAQSDVVIENFSPRVMENFGLDYDELRAVRPDVITVRMPGWGLEGPWRERPGFATTMEQAGGMAWVTGYDGGFPMTPGLCDPLAGIHAAYGILAALEERRATGRGQDLEISMIDMGANVAAEQVIEHAVYGHLMSRIGNHGPLSAPQGAYVCSGENEWVALSVSNDDEWASLRRALGDPSWAGDGSLATAEGRHAAADRLDDELAAWAKSLSLADALAALQGAGVPAEPVIHAYAVDEVEQTRARGFWTSVAHPIVGEVPYQGWPMKLSGDAGPWHHSHAPLLGEHTEEILSKELGLAADEIASLREAGIIGDRPLGL